MYRTLVVASHLKVDYLKGIFTGKVEDPFDQTSAYAPIPIFFKNRHAELASVAHTAGIAVKACVADYLSVRLGNEKYAVGGIFEIRYVGCLVLCGKGKSLRSEGEVVGFFTYLF